MSIYTLINWAESLVLVGMYVYVAKTELARWRGRRDCRRGVHVWRTYSYTFCQRCLVRPPLTARRLDNYSG